MVHLVHLLQELCSSVVKLFRSLPGFLLLVVITGASLLWLVGYLLYQSVVRLEDHPVLWLLTLVAVLAAWFLRRYVFWRKIIVEKDSAVIVKRADGKIVPFYRGRHMLRLGDRVCGWLSLRTVSEETNQEEVFTVDDEHARLSAVYDLYISDPLLFYLKGRKPRIDLVNLNRWAVLAVIQNFSFDEVYNIPYEINEFVAQTINNQIDSYGLRVTNYRLDEVIWPDINERWRRNRLHLASQNGHYWNVGRSLQGRQRKV